MRNRGIGSSTNGMVSSALEFCVRKGAQSLWIDVCACLYTVDGENGRIVHCTYTVALYSSKHVQASIHGGSICVCMSVHCRWGKWLDSTFVHTQ